MSPSSCYLPSGLPSPVAEPDGLSAPYWAGLREERLRVQRCARCRTLRSSVPGVDLPPMPRAFDPGCGSRCPPHGCIFSWERVWHPVHPALKDRGPYLVVVVELPHAGGVRLVGNTCWATQQRGGSA